MKTRCCYPKRYLLLFFSLLVSVGSILMSVSLSSCSSSVKSPLLLSADSLMEIYPDSALSILESISSPQKLPCADRALYLSLIHISEPTRRTPISYAVFCLKKKNTYLLYTSDAAEEKKEIKGRTKTVFI